MALSHLRRGVAFIGPALALAPFLLGADGQGCGPGAAFSSSPAAGVTATDSSSAGCTAADCPGLPPVLPCPSDATSVSSCLAEVDGGCGWSTPVCRVLDAGNADACSSVAPPCAPCPYGSTGTATDANGCSTCPVCSPPPDAAVVCNCPAVLVVTCPDGSSPPIATGPAPCNCQEVGSCPADDAGNLPCSSDADCPTGSACGFSEAEACTVTEGQCFALPGVECGAIALGCACDGTEVNVGCNGLPSGYAPKPLRHTGPCTDGG